MAKLTLPDVGNILGNPTSAQSRINSNNTLIEQALENTLSLDGTSPNQMSTDIDLNGNDLLNVGVVHADSIAIGGSEDFLTLIEQAEEAAEDALLYSQQAAASVIEAGEKVDEATEQAGIATTKAAEAAEAAEAAALFDPTSYYLKTAFKSDGTASAPLMYDTNGGFSAQYLTVYKAGDETKLNFDVDTGQAGGIYLSLAGTLKWMLGSSNGLFWLYNYAASGGAGASAFWTDASNVVDFTQTPTVGGALLAKLSDVTAALGGVGGIKNVRLITASGNVTPSPGVTKWIGFVINGGANGGNVSANNTFPQAGAGGNGGAGGLFIADVSDAISYAAVIGAIGGASSITINGTAYSTAGNCRMVVPAAPGGVGRAATSNSVNALLSCGGAGGDGPFGYGHGGPLQIAPPGQGANGVAGVGYGAGGGGACHGGLGSAYSGGAGTPGCLLLWEF